MLDDWTISTLGDVILGKPQYGLTAKSSTKDGNILYLRISDITDDGELKTQGFHYISPGASDVDKYGLHNGDFLIARSGSVGRVYLHQELEKVSVFASYLIRFRLDTKKVLPKFVFYWGFSPDFKREIEARRKVVAQPNINAKDYCMFKLPVPPLETQGRIISVMDRLCSIRRKREHANQLANTIIQSVFLKMFGDPATNPKMWKEIRIDEACEEIVDCVNRTAPLVDYPTQFKMIRTTNIRNYHISFDDDTRYVTEEVFRRWTRRLLPRRGDVVFTREAPAGEAAIIDTDENVFLGQRIMHYRPNKAVVNPHFLLYELMSNGLKKQINKLGSGSTVKHLAVPDCKRFMIRKPPVEMQNEFAVLVEKVEGVREKQGQSKKELDDLFNSLMRNAFRGELRTTEITAEA